MSVEKEEKPGTEPLPPQGCCQDRACDASTCMNLPDGLTCGDCVHLPRCEAIYGHHAPDRVCDWFPRRFQPRVQKGAGK